VVFWSPLNPVVSDSNMYTLNNCPQIISLNGPLSGAVYFCISFDIKKNRKNSKQQHRVCGKQTRTLI